MPGSHLPDDDDLMYSPPPVPRSLWWRRRVFRFLCIAVIFIVLTAACMGIILFFGELTGRHYCEACHSSLFPSTLSSSSMLSPTEGWADGPQNSFVHYADGKWC